MLGGSETLHNLCPGTGECLRGNGLCKGLRTVIRMSRRVEPDRNQPRSSRQTNECSNNIRTLVFRSPLNHNLTYASGMPKPSSQKALYHAVAIGKENSRALTSELSTSLSGAVERHSSRKEQTRDDLENIIARGSTKVLVERLMQHELLMFVLAREIETRLPLEESYAHAPLKEQQQNEDEIEGIINVIIQLTTRYYDERRVSELVPLVPDGLLKNAIAQSRVYVSPLPHYMSNRKPFELNTSLRKLLWCRPPPLRVIPEICNLLLSSPSPPDARAFNVLVQGLTLLRMTSVSHMVFRHMVNNGIQPDDYSIVALLNLCSKSADFDGLSRVTKILRRKSHIPPGLLDEEIRLLRRRHKMVLEALIVASAKFGHEQRVSVYKDALRRECPESPVPGLYTQTALLKLWTEKKDWYNGQRAWRSIRKSDWRWSQSGKGEPLDLKAIKQWVKHCEACGKAHVRAMAIDLAKQRGFTEQDVIRPYKKRKGLWERSEMKVPWLKEVLRQNTQYRRHGLSTFLKNAIETHGLMDVTPEDLDGTIQQYSLAAAELGWLLSPAIDTAVIWENMLSRRVEVFKNEVEALIRGVKRNDSRELEEERKRKGPQIRWLVRGSRHRRNPFTFNTSKNLNPQA